MRASPFSVIIVFVALMLMGAVMIPRLGVQLHPSTTLPSLTVQFSWSNAPAIQVEREITSKIEAVLGTLSNLEEVRSVSYFGRGNIHLGFKKNTDMELARFEVASRLRRLYPQFPDDVSYPTVTMGRAVGRNNAMLTYTFVAPATGIDIQQYMDDHIQPVIAHMGGVDRVQTYGANPMEYQIVYDAEALRMRRLSSTSLLNALHNHFGQAQLGMAHLDESARESAGKLSVVLATNHWESPDWQTIPAGMHDGRIVYLTDVATIEFTETEPRSYFRINGQNTVGMQVFSADGKNQIRLASAVKQQMGNLEKQLPHGWQVLLTHDDTQQIRKDLNRVGYRMLFSFVILMVFVMLITRNARYVWLIFITMITNLLLAVTWYYFIGIEMHLYSLAGITVSFGIIIDNAIVMIEHMRRHRNKKVFIAILAATLTTTGCLSVIFLLEAEQRAQLMDFAGVVLVNLLLSLVVAWFFVPAVFSGMEKTMVQKALPSRMLVVFSQRYFRALQIIRRFRWLALVLLILGFGLPVHRLPSSMEGENFGSKLYNATFGGTFYQRNIKNTAEKVLGGSLRLFSNYVFERAYFSDPERTAINIQAQMPDGSTIHQLNEAVAQMEYFLLQFQEIEQFESRVSSPQNAYVRVLFKPDFDRGVFPHYMQNLIIRKALDIGGAEWRVYGVGQGFSNVLGRSGVSGGRILVEGYNYASLYRYAEIIRENALEHPRITQVEIQGGDAWGGAGRQEFYLDMNPHHLSIWGLTPGDFYTGLSELVTQRRGPLVYQDSRPVHTVLFSSQHQEYSLWDLANRPLYIAGQAYKTDHFISVERRPTGNDIYKNNQQYRLTVRFNFLGPGVLEQRVREQLIDEINAQMPMGYRAHQGQFSWRPPDGHQYALILLVIVIIYFICSILLESFLQPLAIICLIPMSFIGLFLTFYLFDLNFDQGGLAAFILLSGLSVNSGLYILNDYNNFCRRFPKRNPLGNYLKAFQYKILPVMLTIFSTLIGLIPFVVGTTEAFWFAFAAGTMGGLAFSIPGILLFFPAFLQLGKGQ